MRKNTLQRLFFIPFLAFLAACGGDSPNPNASQNCPPVSTQSKSALTEIDIYVENSASMFGYLQGQTEFKTVMTNFADRLERAGLKNKLFFINDRPYPIDKKFIDALDITEARKYGNTGASRLDLMIETMIDKALKTNKAAFLASDFVYDSTGKKPTDELQKLGVKINDAVKKLEQNNWGLLILRLTSQFNGTYYDLNDKKTELKGEQRPYYIWIAADKNLLKTLISPDMNLQTLAGFELFSLYFVPENIRPYTSILPVSEKKGTGGRPQTKGAIVELNGVEGLPTSREFQLSLAVDLSQIPVAADYLTDANNYVIKSPSESQIVSISPLKNAKIAKNDERFLCAATHVFVINIPKLMPNQLNGDFNIQLLQKTPTWVDKFHTADDSNIKTQLDKSFGLKNIITGVETGFNPNQEPLFYANFGFKLNK